MNKALATAFLALVAALFAPTAAGAQTISVSSTAAMRLGESPYAFGAGAAFEVGLDFGGFDLYPGLAWTGLFLEAGAGRVDVVSAGADLSWPLVRTSTLALGPAAGIDAYGAFYPGAPPLFNPAVSFGLRFDAITGKLRLGLEPSLEILLSRRDGAVAPFWAGVGVKGRVGFEPGGSGTVSPRLELEPPRLEPFFPSFYKYYSGGGLGEVEIRNGERSAIKDLSVQVYVPRYMDGPQTVLAGAELKPGERLVVPLAALFRNEVLGVTETDAVQLQVLARYRRGPSELEVAVEGRLRVLGRNSVSWDDDRKAAAFVTSRDPTILKLGRNVLSGIPVDNPGPGNEAFRKAAAIFSALGEFGLRYVIDPASSYKALSANASAVDYLQFPVQTLDYRSGDCDDLTVLYTALLEAVGVETAFITVPGHIYAAFALGMGEAEARSAFASHGDFVVADGKVWVPVESTLVNKGFLVAWADGARQWRLAAASGQAALVPVRSAWTVYEASFIDSVERGDVVARFPTAGRIAARYGSELKSLTERELAPLVADLNARIAAKATPVLQNRLGAVYARYGVFDKAEAAFREAAKSDYPQAWYNLGNIKFLRKDWKGALSDYERSLRLNPGSAPAAIAVARAAFELGDAAKASESWKAASAIDPARAAEFSYVAGGGTSTGRASDAGSRDVLGWDE